MAVVEAPTDLTACLIAQVLQVTTDTVQTDVRRPIENAFATPHPNCRLRDNAYADPYSEGRLLLDLPTLTIVTNSL